MATKEQKFDYLDDHLPYMVGQLRYDFGKIERTQHFRDWNSYFQSFSVNARNLVEFLDNGDRGNFKASDFIKDFRIRKGDMQGLMTKLRAQVFHLGKSRPRNNDAKFDLSAAKEVLDWIEEGMRVFLEKLSPEDRKAWNAQKADPKLDAAVPSNGPTGPASPHSASSSISTSTTHTSSVPASSVPGLTVVRIVDDGKSRAG